MVVHLCAEYRDNILEISFLNIAYKKIISIEKCKLTRAVLPNVASSYSASFRFETNKILHVHGNLPKV